MKKIIQSIVLISTVFGYSQLTPKYFINEKGMVINQKEFYSTLHQNETSTLWIYNKKDSSKVAKLSNNRYFTMKTNYKDFLNTINKITNKNYLDSTTFIIEYKFKDDYCEGNINNNWKNDSSNLRKKFTSNLKSAIEKNKNIIYLYFFENGIKVQEDTTNSNFYYQDNNGFFRKNFFLNPTLCGSFIICKPNGEILVRNGEYRADKMLEYLEPKIWNSLFTTTH